MSLKYTLLNEVLKSGEKTARNVSVLSGPQIARHAIKMWPTKDLAIICGRAGVAGAIVDGSMGAWHAGRAWQKGETDGPGAAKHVLGEAGCGFVTSSAGTAGTLAAYMVTGTMGPVVLAAGMGASLGSRWAYRKVVGESDLTPSKTPPDLNKDGLEEIGPHDPEE